MFQLVATNLEHAIRTSLVALLMATAFVGFLSIFSRAFFWLNGGMVLLMFAATCAFYGARARGWRTLKEADFMICPQCRYDLRSIEDHAACPECGAPFTPDSLFETWRWSYMAEWAGDEPKSNR